MTNTEAALAEWHAIVTSQDIDRLQAMVHPDAVLRSPVAHHPYHGAQVVVLILANIIQVFEDFTYHREFINPEERSVALEFSARVAGRDLKGIDLIRFDESGKLTEIEVAIRPLSALKTLQAEMMAKLDGAADRSPPAGA